MPSSIRLVCVGKVKEPYLREGMAGYVRRLRPYCKLEIIELPDEGVEREALRLARYLGPDTYLLDAAGKEMGSLEFADLVKRQAMRPLTFIIGSAEGIDGGVKKKAKTLSLSKMTYTHEMARLILLEQVYRAELIARNHPYHK